MFLDLDVNTATSSIVVNGNFGHVYLNSSTGPVRANVNASSLVIEIGLSKVRFRTNAEEIRIKTTRGSARGVIEGDKELYGIIIHLNNGRCNLSEKPGDGSPHSLILETLTGTINIKFDK